MSLGLGIITLFTLLLKYLVYKAGQEKGVEKAQAIGASDEADTKLATTKDMTPEELRDNETIAANAHKIILE